MTKTFHLLKISWIFTTINSLYRQETINNNLLSYEPTNFQWEDHHECENWEVWRKWQRNFKCVGESKRVKKIRPCDLCITLNVMVIDVNVQLSQTENAHLTIPMSYKKNYCCLLLLQHSVRIFEITIGVWYTLIHTIHTLWPLHTHKY